MPDEERIARVARIGAAHAEAEGAGDLAGCLATLVDDPVYEFFPLGRRMTGGARVRRFYEQFFARVPAATVGYELLSQRVDEHGVAQEYSIWLRIDGAVEHFRVLGVLTANEDGSLLSGEQVWASERYVRHLVGDELFAELEPIPSPDVPAGASVPVVPSR